MRRQETDTAEEVQKCIQTYGLVYTIGFSLEAQTYIELLQQSQTSSPLNLLMGRI